MNFRSILSADYFPHIYGHGEGASLELIEFAQNTLRIVFPTDFKDFLYTVGWLSMQGNSIFGIGINVPFEFNLVSNTLSEQMEMEPKMPQVLVPLLNDGSGNHYCLDTSKLVNGICPIVFWNHEEPEDQVPEFVAISFTVWFEELISLLPYEDE